MQIVTDKHQKELKKHGNETFPFLVSGERLSRYETGSFWWHWHPEVELLFLTNGPMCCNANDRTFHLKEGDVLFINANVLHTGSMENFQDCRYTSVTFDTRLLGGFPGSAVWTKYVEPMIRNFSLPAVCIDGSEDWHAEFRALFRELISVAQNTPDYRELEITLRLQRLWLLLLPHLPAASGEYSRNAAEYERSRRIVAYIEQNYMEKISLKDISAHLHLCESECSRLFRRCMNVSLNVFLQEYRVERSLEYLNKREPLTEIAAKTGFSDSNYYSKVFRRVKGCSPREYRRKKS